MKKEYKKPYFEVYEMTEKTGVMQEHSPELGGGDAMGKENSLVWDEEGSFDLWENDEDDDNLWNNEQP